MTKGVALKLTVALAIVGAAAAGVLLSRSDQPAPDGPHDFSALSQAEVQEVLAAVEGASNPSNPALVAEGRALFRSTDVAKRGEACNTCHPDGSSSADIGLTPHTRNPDQPLSSSNFTGFRDPPALWGAGRTAPYFWIGDAPTLTEVVTATIMNHFDIEDPDPAETARQAEAIVAYLKTLDPPTSDFDDGTMSEAALRGEALFQGQGGCIGCHTGPLFTDGLLHDICVPERNGANDPGAPGPPGARRPNNCSAGAGADLRMFNTPILRDVKNTGPYMHNGRFDTLEQVVRFYNQDSSISPLNLTDGEINDIVAYLEAL